jgi:hypothetical protein
MSLLISQCARDPSSDVFLESSEGANIILAP